MIGNYRVWIARAAMGVCSLLPISVPAADLDAVCEGDVCVEFTVFGLKPRIKQFEECFMQRYKNNYDGSKCKLQSEKDIIKPSILSDSCTMLQESLSPKGTPKEFKAVMFYCKPESKEAGIVYIVADALRKREEAQPLMMGVQIKHQ